MNDLQLCPKRKPLTLNECRERLTTVPYSGLVSLVPHRTMWPSSTTSGGTRMPASIRRASFLRPPPRPTLPRKSLCIVIPPSAFLLNLLRLSHCMLWSHVCADGRSGACSSGRPRPCLAKQPCAELTVANPFCKPRCRSVGEVLEARAVRLLDFQTKVCRQVPCPGVVRPPATVPLQYAVCAVMFDSACSHPGGLAVFPPPPCRCNMRFVQ